MYQQFHVGENVVMRMCSRHGDTEVHCTAGCKVQPVEQEGNGRASVAKPALAAPSSKANASERLASEGYYRKERMLQEDGIALNGCGQEQHSARVFAAVQKVKFAKWRGSMHAFIQCEGLLRPSWWCDDSGWDGGGLGCCFYEQRLVIPQDSRTSRNTPEPPSIKPGPISQSMGQWCNAPEGPKALSPVQHECPCN